MLASQNKLSIKLTLLKQIHWRIHKCVYIQVFQGTWEFCSFVIFKPDAWLTSAVSEVGMCGGVVFAEPLQDLFIMQQSVQRPQNKHI